MWPYDYSRPQPTKLLWVSEGIPDYYADLAVVRGGVASPAEFYEATTAKINEVADAPPVWTVVIMPAAFAQATSGT